MAKEKVIIWMDNNNQFGILAAKIAVNLDYEYEVKNISTKYSWKEMREAIPQGPKSSIAPAPQIFLGTTYIGGYKEFLEHFNVDPKKITE